MSSMWRKKKTKPLNNEVGSDHKKYFIPYRDVTVISCKIQRRTVRRKINAFFFTYIQFVQVAVSNENLEILF